MRPFIAWQSRSIATGILAVGIFLGTLLSGGGVAKAAEGMPLDDLLEQIRATLYLVQEKADEAKLPSLSYVDLEVQTQLDVSAEAKASFWDVSAKTSGSTSTEQVLKMRLVPPSALAEKQVGKLSFSKSLASSILAAAKSVSNLDKREPRLSLKTLIATIKFTVKKSAGAEAGFDILPLTPSIGGEVSTANTHSISIVFIQ